MMRSGTFVKLYRDIANWRWYHDGNTMRVFLHLLLLANISDQPFEGTTVKRGEVLISLRTLSEQLSLSISEVRTSISHLESTGEITRRKCGNSQVFSVVSYDKWQSKPHTKSHDDSHTFSHINRTTFAQASHGKKKNGEVREEKEFITRVRAREADAPIGGAPPGRPGGPITLKAEDVTADNMPYPGDIVTRVNNVGSTLSYKWGKRDTPLFTGDDRFKTVKEYLDWIDQ